MCKAKLLDSLRFVGACLIMIPVGLAVIVVGCLFYLLMPRVGKEGGCGWNDWR